MFGTILHRMILQELLKVFLLALFAITGLLLLAGLVAEAQQRGLEPMQILAIMPLIVPSTLPYTLPATTLFATCVVYGRLAADSEILAIKASGVNVLRVVSPAILLGLSLSLITSVLYFWLIPYTQYMLKATVVSNIEDFLYGMLKRKGKLEIPNFDYVMHVKNVEGRKLLDATFMRKDKSNKVPYDVIANAEEAELHVDMEKKQIIITMWNCYIQSGGGTEKAFVGKKDWPIDLPGGLEENTKKSRPMEMSWFELLHHKERLLSDIERVQKQLDRHNRDIERMKQKNIEIDNNVKNHGINLRAEMEHMNLQVRSTLTELHKRPALSFGCLCFVLVGCPVGIWFSRSDYLSAFITCFLPIVFLYYPLTLCGVSMGTTGKVSVVMAVWFADALLAMIAIVLLRKLTKN